MEKIKIVECSPIEGFKFLKKDTSLDKKVDLINNLSRSGIYKIQVASFTHPKLFAHFADAEAVVNSIDKRPGVIYGGLTPSEIACRRAILTDIDEISVVIAASDTYNQVALGHSTRKLMNKILPSVIQIALKENKNVRAYIATSFGCPYEGEIAVPDLLTIASKLDFLGVNQISIADSMGDATPVSVREIFTALKQIDLKADLAIHIHDTRGMGLVNAMAAYDCGVRIFDTSIGGMSAKPFGAPDKAIYNWNVPTEDLVNMFESIGVETGIDMDLLLSCVSEAEKISRWKLSGHILQAGTCKKLYNPPKKLRLSHY